MLIKEYRIPLPMSVEEYRIAQLYMIQKKSRLESTGAESGVEIIENVPYENGPGGRGQYTRKIYHIGSHLPGWLKSLLPKTALRVEEEAWNAYPFTKTRHTCPFIEKFSMDIETRYLPDCGQTENIFKLSAEEQKNLPIDVIDCVKDKFPDNHYRKEEDPRFFSSQKTGRGPLTEDWMEQFKVDSPPHSVMCAYKLIRVEFKYWGMQSKIESFIIGALRNPMLVGHRQAWSWQDEWHGMTMEDIRELEAQTQRELALRMNQLSGNNALLPSIGQDENMSKGRLNQVEKAEQGRESPSDSDQLGLPSASKRLSGVRGSIGSRGECRRGSAICDQSEEEVLLEMRMKDIEQSDSDLDDEYFDAVESLDAPKLETQHGSRLQKENRLSEASISGFLGNLDLEDGTPRVVRPRSLAFNKNRHTLIFVVHGGNVTDPESDTKKNDFETFKDVFKTCSDNCYPGAIQNMSFKLIECNPLTKQLLSQVKVVSMTDKGAAAFENCTSSNSFPFSSIPLLISQSPQFQSACDDMANQINATYSSVAERLGPERNLQVFVLADCLGGLLVYDVLCRADADGLSFNADLPGSFSVQSKKSASDGTDRSRSGSGFSLDIPGREAEDSRLNAATFDFLVSGVFCFGSPVGLVVLMGNIAQERGTPFPACGQFYNLFHPFDPCAARLEPLIDCSFGSVSPAPVPRHQCFPFNNDIQYNFTVLYDDKDDHLSSDDSELASAVSPRDKSQKTCGDRKFLGVGGVVQRPSTPRDIANGTRWWGTKRVDYMLYCPEGIQSFPVSALLHLCYNSYWESKDLVTFLLWQIMDEGTPQHEAKPITEYASLKLVPTEKWLRKRTKIKIKNLSSNHRANDIVTLESAKHVIGGKFAYGPCDIGTLSGEKVDVYAAKRPQLTEWQHLGCDVTDGHGRLSFTVPAESRLATGIYSIKLVVRGDHSYVDLNVAIVPAGTEVVIFSIDGSFLASYSLSGVDPKIRGGAVDAVRYWHDLGYLIIYVSSRLLFQKHQVMRWLAEHKFPFGVVSFCEAVSTDYQKHKLEFLKNLVKSEKAVIHAAYGSSRDLPVYTAGLKLAPQQVFVIGKRPAKQKKAEHAQWISDGYAQHLRELLKHPLSRPSANNRQVVLGQGPLSVSAKVKDSPKRKAKVRDEDVDVPDSAALSRSDSARASVDPYAPRKGLRRVASNNP